MTDQPPARRAWFKRKDFGGGATPATWEGWACTAGFVVLLFAGLGVTLLWGGPRTYLNSYLVYVGVVSVLFLALARWKSDGPWFGG